MNEPVSGTTALTERVDSVTGEVFERRIENRLKWEKVERQRQLGKAPFFHNVASLPKTLPAPKFKFLDTVIVLTHDSDNDKATCITGQVIGMEWQGDEWGYLLFSTLNAPYEATESELYLHRPELVQELTVYLHWDEEDGAVWVFDDAEKGLEKEGFVYGIDVLIDRMTILMDEPEKGFVLMLSDHPFPDFRARLHWLKKEGSGNWYRCPQYEVEGWLCSALNKYFPQYGDEVPAMLFFSCAPLPF